MNPRFRRLLIPGLLVALLVVVLVAAIFGRADGAEPDQPVDSDARLADRRPAHHRVERTRRSAPSTATLPTRSTTPATSATVFAIRISTGKVVGTTSIRGATWLDTEALALRDGTLWVADTGDNAGSRIDAALYALDEPGPGDHTVGTRSATR